MIDSSVSSSSPAPFTTSVPRDPTSCENYCQNNGSCQHSGPGGTAVCSCVWPFEGTHCERQIYYLDFYKQDPVTNVMIASLIFAVSILVLVLGAVFLYRKYKLKKNKKQGKPWSPQYCHQRASRIFQELHGSSQDQLLLYQVTQPSTAVNTPVPPVSPEGQGICYLTPNSPECLEAPQDFHNPGYRQSYIESVL